MTDVKSRYQELQEKLNYETGFYSSIRRKTEHPAYLEIVGLGQSVVGVILERLDRFSQTHDIDDFDGPWIFNALVEITGFSPKVEAPGVIFQIVRGWVDWGEMNGHLAPDRPKYEPKPIPRGWVVIGYFRGEEHALCPKRDPRNLLEEKMGSAPWVTRIDHAGGNDPHWWKRFAWILNTREEAEEVLRLLIEKFSRGEGHKENFPERAWIEEV